MISDQFIRALLRRLDSPNVTGIGLTGSYARGQEDPFSDVDLDIFVNRLPESDYERYTLRYWDRHLVSLTTLRLSDERAAFSRPERAIWMVPALRQMKILLDKDGSLALFQKEALAFQWEDLQPAADRYAAEEVMGCAEEVHKILTGLKRSHESTVMNAVEGLARSLLGAVAVQRGLLIPTENLYLDIVQEAVGRDSDWTHALRRVWGLEAIPTVPVAPITAVQFQARGAAALDLYRHTAGMLQGLMPDQHRAVVESTLKLIDSSGYKTRH